MKTSTYIVGKWYLHVMYAQWRYGPFDSANAADLWLAKQRLADSWFASDGISRPIQEQKL